MLLKTEPKKPSRLVLQSVTSWYSFHVGAYNYLQHFSYLLTFSLAAASNLEHGEPFFARKWLSCMVEERTDGVSGYSGIHVML